MMGVTAFQAQIALLIEFLGVQWTKPQIDECGELAYQECYWFSLAELKQFFDRIKKGHYQSNKNFRPDVFMQFMVEYSEEMLAARYDHFSQQKPKPRKVTVLDVTKMKGKSRKVAEWMCSEIRMYNEQMMKQTIDSIQNITESMSDSPAEPTINPEAKARMDIHNEERRLLDEAKRKALESIKDLDPRIADELKKLCL